MLSLCFYFQRLLGPEQISWACYGSEFLQHLGEYSNKCVNKLLDPAEAVCPIQRSDIVIYQEIDASKSTFSNQETLSQIKKKACRLIKMPSIHFDYADYESSMKELERRESQLKVDIRVSAILKKFCDKVHMLTLNHPDTFLFLELAREICLLCDIEFFDDGQAESYRMRANYMELPQ
jgi:hypothetical protein